MTTLVICLYLCVCTHVWVHVCMYVGTCRGQRTVVAVIPQMLFTLFLRQSLTEQTPGSSLFLWGWLSSPWGLPGFVPFPTPKRGSKRAPPPVSAWVWEFELRSLCFICTVSALPAERCPQRPICFWAFTKSLPLPGSPQRLQPSATSFFFFLYF